MVLGCGEMRFLRTLEHIGKMLSTTGLAIRQPGYAGAYGKRGLGGYFDFVLTQPVGTADQDDESVVGRVNLKRVRQWCDNDRSTYHVAPSKHSRQRHHEAPTIIDNNEAPAKVDVLEDIN